MTTLKTKKTLWCATQSMPKFFPLTKDINVDVCVVGGGIAGLTTAYLLQKEGKTVCILDAFELASGQTARTTAHLVTALDDRYIEIEKLHGQTAAKLAASSHRAAIEKVDEIIRQEGIDCDLERLNGYLFSKDDPHPQILKKEYEAVRRAGIYDVEYLTESPIQSFNMGPCLRFSDQLQFHPLKYLAELAQRIESRGALIFTNTQVTEVHGGEAAYVTTGTGFKVHCEDIVIATNTPINDLVAIHTKQAPYRSYVMGFKIPKGSVPLGLYWDTLDPYHYIRLAQDNSETHEILMVGGEDHKTGQKEHPERCFSKLEEWTRVRFPVATEILYQWSGQVMEPVDGLAFLGRNPMDEKNVYVVTGDSGNGMTHCTIGAMLITDLIMERSNPWEELYNPSRISFKALPEFIKENVNVAAQYKEWLSANPKPYFPDLIRGEGVVFRDGFKMVAAYKNAEGTIELMSAACTHLGGVVVWNEVEKSWDCPCHGSRFSRHGQVIEGPAIQNLKKFDHLTEAIETVLIDPSRKSIKVPPGKTTDFHH